MSDAGDLSDAIEQAAQEPLSASGDEGSMQSRSINELIDADRYLASKRAAHTGRGFRMTKLSPPGTA